MFRNKKTKTKNKSRYLTIHTQYNKSEAVDKTKLELEVPRRKIKELKKLVELI